MRKNRILLFATIAIIGTGIVVACNKKNKSADPTQPATTHNVQKQDKIGTFSLGSISVTATYSSGCLKVVSSNLLWGLYSHTEESCLTGCTYCKITGIISVSVNADVVGTNSDGNKGLKIPTSGDPSNYYGVFTISQNNMEFAVDITKVPTSVQSQFLPDNINIARTFLIDDSIAHNLGLDSTKQFVPANNYSLFRDGDIIWWQVPTSQLTGKISLDNSPQM